MSEELSAFMDGELDAARVASVSSSLKQSDEARGDWTTYHVIRDAINMDVPPMAGFAARFHERLSSEPSILAPKRARPFVTKPQTVWLAAASLAAVALTFWNFGAQTPAPQNIASVATPYSTNSNIVPASAIVEANPYVIAHQEYAPTTAMEGVAPYIRTISASRQDTIR